jgi:tol-pal system protein YbgF
MGALLALAGCGPDVDVERRTREEMVSLRSEVSGARQAAAEAASRAASADQRARGLEAGLQAVDRALAEQRAEAAGLRARLGKVEAALGGPATRGSAATADAAATPDAAYAGALARFRNGEHAQAVLDFRDFLGRHPAHRLAVNAQYWIGEAYFAAREWGHALKAFEQAVERYGPTGKSPDALLMMGRCLAMLDESARARVAWERVVSEYPASGAAAHAQRFLRAAAGLR